MKPENSRHLEGSVSIILEDDDGKEVVITYLNPGDFFGEMGLFEKGNSRSARCRARTIAENAVRTQRINYVKRN